MKIHCQQLHHQLHSSMLLTPNLLVFLPYNIKNDTRENEVFTKVLLINLKFTFTNPTKFYYNLYLFYMYTYACKIFPINK